MLTAPTNFCTSRPRRNLPAVSQRYSRIISFEPGVERGARSHLRRTLLISAVAVGAMLVIAAALVAYAFFNLSSILASNQKRILARLSNALRRPVEGGHL